MSVTDSFIIDISVVSQQNCVFRREWEVYYEMLPILEPDGGVLEMEPMDAIFFLWSHMKRRSI